MKALFFETSSFTATVSDYLTDDEYRELQIEMVANPNIGVVMPRTGGFRKLRWLMVGEEKAGEGACESSTTGCQVTARYGCSPSTIRMSLRI